MSRPGALRLLGALLCGAIFGLGLAVSGMMNPAKVTGFLNIAGDWDPTLVFVMGGALAVTVPAFRLILGRPKPVLDRGFSLPDRTSLDGRLISGAALFGVGWGMVGFCPGPAVAALSTGLTPVLVFVAAMVAGMVLQSFQQSAFSNQLSAVSNRKKLTAESVGRRPQRADR